MKILEFNDIEYTEEQKDFLLKMSDIIDTFNKGGESNITKEVSLQGYAGTGKTTIAKNVIKYVNYLHSENKTTFNKCVVLAPTNKAKQVLSSKLKNIGCRIPVNIDTLHKALYGAPEEKEGVTIWTPGEPIINAFILVDEASMVSMDIMTDLRLLSKKCLILYTGDAFQLEPVGEKNDLHKLETFRLTEVKRVDNSIINLATKIRTLNRNVYPIENTENITVIHNQKDFLNDYVEKYQEETDSVLIVATNKLRNDLNERIRRKLGHEGYLNPNEVLMSINNNQNYSNGDVFVVNNINILEEITIGLKNGDDYDDVNVILAIVNENIPLILVQKYDKPSLYSTQIRKAIGFEEITKYDEFARQYSSYNKYNGSINHNIDRYSLSGHVVIATYGYCISCHKSQGSEYTNVFVHHNYNAPTWNGAQWFYTAVTRSKENLFILPAKFQLTTNLNA